MRPAKMSPMSKYTESGIILMQSNWYNIAYSTAVIEAEYKSV